MISLAILSVAIFITIGNYFFTKWFIKYAISQQITDIPNERSSHIQPTPRGGGIGFVTITLISYWGYILFENSAYFWENTVFVFALSLMALLGWLDDKYNLSNGIRFVAQSLIALVVVIFLSGMRTFYIPYVGLIELGFWGNLVALIWIVGVTNIFNFMDGIDAIASVQAICVAFGWIIFGFLWHHNTVLVFNVFILFTVIAFLIHNWPPASVFMGDVGSIFLGFAFSIMPFYVSATANSVPLGYTIWIAVLMLWPFLFDAAFTILRRLVKKENILEAHRSHLYQRLNIIGWDHFQISLTYFIAALLCVIASIVFYYYRDLEKTIVISLLVVFSFIFILFVSREEKRNINT